MTTLKIQAITECGACVYASIKVSKDYTTPAPEERRQNGGNDMSKIRVRKIRHTAEYARNLLRYGRRIESYDFSTVEGHFGTMHEVEYRNIIYWIYMDNGNVVDCWHVH